MAGVNADLFGRRRSRLSWLPGVRAWLRRRYLRQRAFAVALAPDRMLCRVLGRYKLYVHPHDQSISPHLMVDGYWEPRVTELVVDLMRPGMVAIDVGANLGYFTVLMAAECGPGGHVLAFEPYPPTAALLRASVAVNGFAGRVTIFEEPLSHSEGGEVTLYVPPGHPGGVQRTPPGGDGENYLRCRTRRLDQVPRAAEAALIKIDAEGMEEEIWQGMAGLIAGDRLRHVILEFTIASCHDPARMIDEARAAGFALHRIDEVRGALPVTRAEILAGPELQMLLLSR